MYKTGGISIKNRHKSGKAPLKPTLTKENSFLVFPFDLVAGYITSTEKGLKQADNILIDNYSHFQRVFTGLENMLAQWTGAYKVYKKDDNDNFLTKDYQVGNSVRAFIPQESLAASFEPSNISSDFLAEFTDEEFTLHVYENINEAGYLFKLFIIPELRADKWMYISRAERYYWNGKFHHSEVTLTTLNNKVAKTGRSIEAFIQRGAPGEGYAWPVIDKDQNVTLDSIAMRDVPVTSGQVEMSGPAAINTIVAYGRPTIQKTTNGITETIFNPKIEAPRLLLPLRLETAIPSPENTRPSAETDYYVGDFKPTLHEEYKSWREQFQGSFSLAERNSYEGVLIGTKDLGELRKSNPVDSVGTHTHELWDTTFRPHQDSKHDTKPNALTGDKLDYLGTSYSIPEILAHNFFITSHLISLPLTVQQNVAWGLNDIPIIGGFLSKLTLGVPIGWRDISVRLSMPSVNLIMPSSLAEYGNVLKGDGSPSTDVWIPLETFTGQRKDEATDNSGINATGTIFKVEYTHRFKKAIDGVFYVFDTIQLGQKHPTVDDEGTAIVGTLPEKLLWDITCIPTNRGTVPGYVIDMPHFKTIAKLDYRKTFFSNDIQIWTGTYETQAKFTDSIRDWTNTVKMSNWKEENNKTIYYPSQISAPKPPTSNFPKFSIPEAIATIPSVEITRDYLLKNGAIVPSRGGNLFVDINTDTVLSEATFDLKDINGVAGFRQNYQKITFNFGQAHFAVNVGDLITAGQKEIDNLYTWSRDIVSYQKQREFTSTRTFPADTVLKATIRVKVFIDGDILKIQLIKREETGWQSSSFIAGHRHWIGYNAGTWITSDFKSTPSIDNIQNIVLIPNPIII